MGIMVCSITCRAFSDGYVELNLNVTEVFLCLSYIGVNECLALFLRKLILVENNVQIDDEGIQTIGIN